MATLQADLKEFIALLNSHNVDTSLSAVTQSPSMDIRDTGGINVFVGTTSESAQRLLRALDVFLFEGVGIAEDNLIEQGRVVSLAHPPNRIDILTSISGVDFASAWESRVQTVLDDQPVRCCAGWSFLRTRKLLAARKTRLIWRSCAQAPEERLANVSLQLTSGVARPGAEAPRPPHTSAASRWLQVAHR